MNFWRYAIGLVLALQLAQQNLYILGWSSPLPVQLTRVETTGSLIQVITSGDNQSGTIAVLAPRACVSIAAEGQTTAGIRVRFVRSWLEECDRVWAPWIGR